LAWCLGSQLAIVPLTAADVTVSLDLPFPRSTGERLASLRNPGDFFAIKGNRLK